MLGLVIYVLADNYLRVCLQSAELLQGIVLPASFLQHFPLEPALEAEKERVLRWVSTALKCANILADEMTSFDTALSKDQAARLLNQLGSVMHIGIALKSDMSFIQG